MMRDTYTALSVPVTAALVLQPFRVQHISTPAATMPPHVSIFGPFMKMEMIDRAVLQALQETIDSFPQFSFSLHKTGRFSDIHVLYLEPDPAAPFLALHRAIRARFPELVPNFLDPVMHLTVARVNDGELDQIEAEFYREYGNNLPVKATASEVGLYEKCDGAWHQRASLALAASSAIQSDTFISPV